MLIFVVLVDHLSGEDLHHLTLVLILVLLVLVAQVLKVEAHLNLVLVEFVL